jgi:hypothetical protein
MVQSKATRRRDHDNARERAARLRAEQARRERRRRMAVVGGSVLGVLALVAVIVVIGVTSNKGSSNNSGASDRTPAPAALVAQVTGVPAATLDAVGAGTVGTAPKAVKDPSLTSGGKPQVFYVGAEFCPYCAASRWALVQALSRFGTFHNLSTTSSSSTDVYPDTPTFSFHGAAYTSDTIAFDAHELQTRTGAALDSLPSNEETIWHRYTGQQGSFPFLDIAGRYVETGQTVNPAVLKGLTADEIASRLANASDPVAKEIIGSANLVTAAICTATGDQPTTVCSAGGVVAAKKALGG